MSNLFLSLPQNIFLKLIYLKQDYLGIGFFNLSPILNLFLGFFIALTMIFISYLLGNKLRSFFQKTNPGHYPYLIDIALGYLVIGTGVTLLGFFSLLNSLFISFYIVVILLFSFYPLSKTKKISQILLINLQATFIKLKANKFIFFWVCLFVFIGILNLMNPEIREDQYHVDFPKMYLSTHTIMVAPKEQFTVSGSPMLGEMYYTIGIFLWNQESARYIHFIFYILVLLTLFEFTKISKYSFSRYNLLLLASSPIIIHEISSMYVDFEWMFCFLVSILILTTAKKISLKEILLSGLILGAMFASKMWTIIIIPVSIVYLIILLNKIDFIKKLKYITVFITSAFIIPSVWLIRAYLLTGDPLFPAFIRIPTLETGTFQYGLSHYLGLNTPILNPLNFLNVFSPIFFLGCIFFIYKLKDNISALVSLKIFKLLLILLLTYLSVQYPYGRYLLGLYIFLIFFSSLSLSKIIDDLKLVRYLINIILLVLFSYYLINSILVLPYTFGITDKNKYLTRILSRDWSSYYNFDKKFDKYISKNDYVATYGIFGYYYADFKYLDINFVFDSKHKSFEILKRKGFTKLFIKGGDINYFCKQINLKDCSNSHYTLISSYRPFPGYYLYNLK